MAKKQMKYEKIQVRQPEYGFESMTITTKVKGVKRPKLIAFTKQRKGKKIIKGIQVSAGLYGLDSGRAYVKSYPLSKIPKKYKGIISKLEKIHKRTKWSKKKEIPFPRNIYTIGKRL